MLFGKTDWNKVGHSRRSPVQIWSDKKLQDAVDGYNKMLQDDYNSYVTNTQRVPVRGFYGMSYKTDTSIPVNDFDTWVNEQKNSPVYPQITRGSNGRLASSGRRSQFHAREAYYAPILSEHAQRTNVTAAEAINRQNQAKATEVANNPVVDTGTETEKKSGKSSGYSGGNKRTRFTSNPIIGGVSSRTGIKI